MKKEQQGISFITFLFMHILLTCYIIAFETIMYGVMNPIGEPMTITAGDLLYYLVLCSLFILGGLLLFTLLVIWIKEKFFVRLNGWIYLLLVGLLFSTLYLYISHPIHEAHNWYSYTLIPFSAFTLFSITYGFFTKRNFF